MKNFPKIGKRYKVNKVQELVVGNTYWTDYPFAELGDMIYEPAPVRSVTLVYYDGDKYCDVFLNNISTINCLKIMLQLKAGYLYKSPQRMNSHGDLEDAVCSDELNAANIKFIKLCQKSIA
jgi:hypothetical protein